MTRACQMGPLILIVWSVSVATVVADGQYAGALGACAAASAGPGFTAVAANAWVDVDGGASPDPDPAFTLWWLSDVAPQAGGRPGPLSLSTAYRHVLSDRETPLPNPTPSALERERVARGTLLKPRPWIVTVFAGSGPPRPSTRLVTYRTYEKAWLTAQEALAHASTPADREFAAVQVASVDANWRVFGFRQEVDDAFEVIKSVQANAPGFWQQLDAALIAAERSTSRGRRYLLTQAWPPYDTWNAADGWLPCSAGGAQSFEFKIVQLQRGWFDRDAVFSHGWRWARASPYSSTLVSDGAGGTSHDPGWVPIFPAALVLIRNASIDVAPGVHVTTPATPRVGGWLVISSPRSPDPQAGLVWPSDGLTAPRRFSTVSVGVIAALTWSPRQFELSELRHHLMPPNPALVVQPSPDRVGIIIGLGLGPGLRGTGAVAGIMLPVRRSPMFVLGGGRFPLGANDGFRFVIGGGVRLWPRRPMS